MKTILLFIALCVSFSMSQKKGLNLTGWESLAAAASTNCETIGGYRNDNGTIIINIYGGRATPTAKYIYDTVLRDYTSTTTSTNSISFINQAVQRDDALFYIETGDIIALNMETDSTSTFATLDASDQVDPALCFDDLDSTKLYVVGDGQIKTCVEGNTCTTQSQDLDIAQPVCEVYNGEVFIFGGVGPGDNVPVNTTWKCDPTSASSCIEMPAELNGARGGIRSIRIDCFGNNYVLLIGGRTELTGEASDTVEIFNVETETIDFDASWNLATPRKHFVVVYDPTEEQIFVFGGNTDVNPNTCTDSVEVTTSGSQGLCWSGAPTMDPTMDPTIDPTIDPTVDPTIDPTIDPTMDPTIDPTMEPTLNPTGVPTAQTSNPTSAPTEPPVVVIETSQTTVEPPTPQPTRLPYSPDTSGNETSPWLYVFVIVLLVIICCIVIVCGYWYSKQDDERDNVADIETAVVVTYCENCSKALPCNCSTCNKCGKRSCEGDCGQSCPSCGNTTCDGNACRQTQ